MVAEEEEEKEAARIDRGVHRKAPIPDERDLAGTFREGDRLRAYWEPDKVWHPCHFVSWKGRVSRPKVMWADGSVCLLQVGEVRERSEAEVESDELYAATAREARKRVRDEEQREPLSAPASVHLRRRRALFEADDGDRAPSPATPGPPSSKLAALAKAAYDIPRQAARKVGDGDGCAGALLAVSASPKRSPAGPAACPSLRACGPEMKKVEKKLRQVEGLEKKLAGGGNLSSEEVVKVASKAALQKELENLIARAAASTGTVS